MDIRCKRCLLREMANEDMYHRIQRTIDAIPPKLRCSKVEYDARLALCKECEKLIGGMCRVCGCFVEVRAAKKSEHCPGIPRRWDGQIFCHNLLLSSRNGGNYNNERNSNAVW